MGSACGTKATLRTYADATRRAAMVGEWSLATTDCMTWLNGVGLSAGALTSTPSAR